MPDYSSFPVTNGITTYLAAPGDYDVDFDNPQRNHHLTLYLIVGIGNLLALLFMFQRLYTKFFLVKGLQIEDGFLVASWICSVIVQSVTIWSVAIDARGVHAWEQPIERYALFKISVYIGGAVFMPCASFAKVALLIFYLRLSPEKWFRIAVWSSLALIAGYTPAIFFALLFACQPVHSAYVLDVKGECIDTTALFIATCVVNIFSDVVIFLLPIYTIWGLKMPLTQRLGVLAMFSVGVITILTSVVRAAILPQMSGADQSWVTASASIWSQLECNLLVICGTVPTLKKFFRHMLPKLMGSSHNSHPTSSNTPRVTPRTTSGRNPYQRRNQYARFGAGEETEVEMSHWDPNEVTNPNKGVSHTVVTGGDTTRINNSDDDSSEKGIMHTRSVIVERH